MTESPNGSGKAVPQDVDSPVEVTLQDVQTLVQSNALFKEQLLNVALRRRIRELQEKLANAEKEKVA